MNKTNRWPRTQGERVFTILITVVSTLAVAWASRHANILWILLQQITFLFMTGFVIVAFYLGKHAGRSTFFKPWANYARVYVVVSLLTLVWWNAYGTEVAEWDLRSGPRVVRDFHPTAKERSAYGVEVFFTLLPAALFGVYRGRKEQEEAEVIGATVNEP